MGSRTRTRTRTRRRGRGRGRGRGRVRVARGAVGGVRFSRSSRGAAHAHGEDWGRFRSFWTDASRRVRVREGPQASATPFAASIVVRVAPCEKPRTPSKGPRSSNSRLTRSRDPRGRRTSSSSARTRPGRRDRWRSTTRGRARRGRRRGRRGARVRSPGAGRPSRETRRDRPGSPPTRRGEPALGGSRRSSGTSEDKESELRAAHLVAGGDDDAPRTTARARALPRVASARRARTSRTDPPATTPCEVPPEEAGGRKKISDPRDSLAAAAATPPPRERAETPRRHHLDTKDRRITISARSNVRRTPPSTASPATDPRATS